MTLIGNVTKPPLFLKLFTFDFVRNGKITVDSLICPQQVESSYCPLIRCVPFFLLLESFGLLGRFQKQGFETIKLQSNELFYPHTGMKGQIKKDS